MLPKIPIIRLNDATDMPLPAYADGIGTCMILQAAITNPIKIAPGQTKEIPTGFACALPVGMEAQVRSLKNAGKTGLVVLNAPATFDASDREEIVVTLYNAGTSAVIVHREEAIAILVFSMVLRVQWDEIENERISVADIYKSSQIITTTQEQPLQEGIGDTLTQDMTGQSNEPLDSEAFNSQLQATAEEPTTLHDKYANDLKNVVEGNAPLEKNNSQELATQDNEINSDTAIFETTAEQLVERSPEMPVQKDTSSIVQNISTQEISSMTLDEFMNLEQNAPTPPQPLTPEEVSVATAEDSYFTTPQISPASPNIPIQEQEKIEATQESEMIQKSATAQLPPSDISNANNVLDTPPDIKPPVIPSGEL